MNNSNIEQIEAQIKNEIHVEQDTGESYCSIRGTARLAGVSPSALSQGNNTSGTFKSSKLVKHLTSKGFNQETIETFKTKGVPGLAVAAIIEYYAFEAGRYKTEQAVAVYRVFAAIGIRAYFQELKGWVKPDKPELSIASQLKEQMPEVPTPWECRYHEDFWTALQKCYGLEQEHKACASFINTYVYRYFPKEVQRRIQEINPILEETGKRKNLIHQHFDLEILEVLKAHIHVVTINLLRARNQNEFRHFMTKVPKYRFSQSTIFALAEACGFI